MSKYLLILFLGIAGFSCASAQTIVDSSTVMVMPEKVPAFKNGVNGWIRFLEKNLDRNLLTKQNVPSGQYRVIASFLVETDGSVKDILIEFDPGFGTADEVKRVLKLSNKQWIPAYDKGQAVAFRHRQSITLVAN